MFIVQKRGFALPTILIASSVMMIVLVVAIQAVVATSGALQSQRLSLLAREASESGMAMARACLTQSDNVVTWTGKSLRPWTNCNGDIADSSWPCASAPNGDSRCWLVYQTDVRTSFTVPAPTTATDGRTRNITSTAVVEQIRASTGQAWRSTSYAGSAQSTPLNVSKISTGRDFACSLLTNAQLYCWGYNVQGVLGPSVDPNVSSPSRLDTTAAFAGRTITSISEGSFSANHMCAVASNEAYCWGGNIYGQLGDGSADGSFRTSPEPVKVASGGSEVMPANAVTEVVVGDSGSCAIASGRAYCWGDNTYGQLGNNNSSMTYSAKPVAVSMPAGTVTDISYTQHTVCAIMTARVYCWGNNQWNQIGDGTNANRYAATLVGGVIASRTATVVQTSHATTCTIASNEVYCWGIGGEGALGDGAASSSNVPLKVANGAGSSLNGKTPTKLSAGFHYNCALTSDGRVSCWGLNGAAAQLGTGSFGGNRNYPTEVSGLAAIGNATELSSANDKSCVVISASTYCWGSLYDGQRRFGVTTPTAVTDSSGPLNGKTINAVATGGPTSCATATDGTTACWGSNNNGTVGDGTTTNRTVPTAVTGGSFTGKTVSSITVGDNGACVIANAEFWCWGQNSAGKAGDGTQGDKLSAVRVSTAGVLSGKTPQRAAVSVGGVSCGVANGAPHCWGGYASAPRATLLGNNTLVQANGAYFTTTPVAVFQESGFLSGKTVTDMSNGTQLCVVASGVLYCWGTNDMGQLGINSASAGSSKPVAVLAEAGVLSGKTVTKVATGRQFGCAATSEPNVYCWGYNLDGQYGNNTRASSLKPVLVTTTGSSDLVGKTPTKLTAGKAHVCAVTTENKLYCWGYNALGQLGDGTNISRFTPMQVQGPLASLNVTDVSAQDYSTCAVASGKAYCWGSNDYGQVGNGTSQVSAAPSPGRSLKLPPFLTY